MPSTTDNVTIDRTRSIGCPHCGAALPAHVYRPLGGTGDPVVIGYEPCTCDAAEAERSAAEEAAAAEECERERAARKRAVELAGIPPRYTDADHPEAQRVADGASVGQSYYIYGPNGTGKTTLAMAAALRLVAKGRKVCVVSTYDFMDAMRSRKDEDRALFNRAASDDVLILDDLGKEASNTPYACERLFAVIDKRDKAMLPAIITSNYRLSEIAKTITEGAVGVAIASRLRGSCEQLPLDGRDRRLDYV